MASKFHSRFALLFVQLDDRSQAFIQFLETMNSLEPMTSQLDCDQMFWRCSAEEDI